MYPPVVRTCFRARRLAAGRRTRPGPAAADKAGVIWAFSLRLCCILLVSFGFLIPGRAQPPKVVSPNFSLGTPPPPPSARPGKLTITPSAQTNFGTNWVNTASREESRQFFNLVFGASEDVSMEWSGSYDTGQPGTNSTTYLDAVLRRVNYYRSMAGVPAIGYFRDDYNTKAQAAALIMGANNALSHFPDTNWLFYSDPGAEGARNSNLSLGQAGPEAISGQVHDFGNGNADVGHRRWILYPQTRTMGAGNVPEIAPYNSANALWVLDDGYWTPRPPTRQPYVSWPPPGYAPYPVVYPRWSFSYPQADFSAATVDMTSNGVPLAVRLETVHETYGENTLVWVPAGMETDSVLTFARPTGDTVYQVRLGGVLLEGVPQPFTYEVTVIDPAVPGWDYLPPRITGPTQPIQGATNLYAFTVVSNAASYQWRLSSPAALTFSDGAENGATNFSIHASTQLYDVVNSAISYSGSFAFHLAHTQTVNQTLTLQRTLLAATNSLLRFQSRLGYATSNQVAKVQLSLDEGASWTDVYAQAGIEGTTETAFHLRTVDLNAYAGRSCQLRLNYSYQYGSYYPQASSGVGWYVDDFTLLNFQELRNPAVSVANNDCTFAFVPVSSSPYLLQVRPLLFGDYPAEWGPGLAVQAAPTVWITSLQTASPGAWQINFSVSSGTPAAFELWSSEAATGPFVLETGATLETILAGAQYRATVTSSQPQRFYRIRAL